MNLIVIATAVVSVLAPAVGGPVAVDPPAGEIGFELVTGNGSGCQQDAITLAASPDNTSFTVGYSGLAARLGVGATRTDFRKNCQLGFYLETPAGYSYAISKVEYRGHASLALGAKAEHRTTFYSHGTPSVRYEIQRFTGPMDDDWRWESVVEPGDLIWYPCGVRRYLNLATELRVTAGTSDVSTTTSLISADATDGVSARYQLTWKRCPEA